MPQKPTLEAALYRRRLRDRIAIAAMRELMRRDAWVPNLIQRAWTIADDMMAERARRDGTK